jgi:hypothetical protein
MKPTESQYVGRRKLLGATLGATVTSLTGCLRLRDGEESEPPSGDGSGETTERTYTIDGFYPVSDSFRFNRVGGGVTAEPSELHARTMSKGLIEIEGRWEGDEQLFTRQACALYSFEVLENDSVILSSNKQILMVYYLFRAVQTDDTLYVTCQPSVSPEWESNLILTGAQDSGNAPAEIDQNQGVFEIDLSQADVRPGDYNWKLEVTPPNNHTFEIGDSYEDLISVGADEADGFRSQTEAIEKASEPSNMSAKAVESPPSDDTATDLTIEGKAYYFGEIQSTRNVTRDVSVQCSSGCEFTPEHALRINNLTSGTSITFSF